MKQKILYLIVGLLGGLIAGFWFANYINRNSAVAALPVPNGETAALSNSPAQPSQTSNLPPEKQKEVKEAEKLANDNQQSFDAQMEVAKLYNEIRDYGELLEHLTLANKLRPDNYGAIVALGNVNFDTGNFAKAEQWYLAALNIKPGDTEVRTDLANTFFLREPPDLERAVAEYKRSLKSNPAHEFTLQNLTAALTRQGNIKEARATFARLEEVNPNNAMLGKLRAELENK